MDRSSSASSSGSSSKDVMVTPANIQRRPPGPQVSQHDELIKFIHESWSKITSETGRNGPVFYKSMVDAPRFKGF